MMSDKAPTCSEVLGTPDMMATSSERRIEHRSILQWGFTHQLHHSGRLDREVGHRKLMVSGYRLRNSLDQKQVGYIPRVEDS